ncbi:MAG: crossover junction endodeoxyribonuclease RuvC [Rickettsiales bacterium]|jgi:crossover junction endodeoxyribonuclease RuvC|nr:crossover junction endodeoxyribonuclease RuvC [Rickettsiales bacterium]
MRRIIGIDPGLRHTGWAVIEAEGNNRKYIASGVIHPNVKETLPNRLLEIFDGLQKVAREFGPTQAAIEITFVNENPTTTLLLGHARAAAITALATAGLCVAEYEPTLVKKAIVGTGRADKEQIAKMVSILMPLAKPKTSDEADALAIALTHANTSDILTHCHSRAD